jgi:hypothetical protein
MGSVACAAGNTNAGPAPSGASSAVRADPGSTSTPIASVATPSIDAGRIASPDVPDEAACGGGDVDLAAVLANRRCRARRDAPATPPSASKDLKVTLVASASKVAPGGHLDLALEIVNASAAPIPLYFSGDLTLVAEVRDAKGVRISPPAGNAPKSADPRCAEVDCRLPASHVVIAPGAKAHARVGWDAVKAAWPTPGPTTCCTYHVDPVAIGPLAEGTYSVKLPLPYESNGGNPADPEIAVRVGK